MGHTYAEAAQMTYMDCEMLDYATPFPIVLVPVAVAVVAFVIAVPVPVVAIVDPAIAGDTGGSHVDLYLHHQVSNKSN